MVSHRFRGRSKTVGVNLKLDHSRRFQFYSGFRFLRNFISSYQGHVRDEDFFRIVASRMMPETFRRVFIASTTPAFRRSLLKLDKGEKIDLSCENSMEIMLKLWEHPASNLKFRTALSNYLDAELLLLDASLRNDPASDAERFAKLGKFFKLSQNECDLLLLAYLAQEFWECAELRGTITYSKFHRFSCALGIPENELQKISSPNARLRMLECLDSDLDFNCDLFSYLSGVDNTPLENAFYRSYTEELLPWEFFGELSERHGETLAMLISDKQRQTGLHVLFYGAPGTGKTSFAAALAARLGRTAYFIDQKRGSRLAAIQICELQRNRDDSLIVIDEADKLLDCAEMNFFGFRKSNGDKGELNSILDRVKTPCIWIVNTPAAALDASNCRRFDYSIEFKPLDAEQRARIWRNSALKHGVELPPELILNLAERYPISAGGIELALRNSAPLEGGNVEERISKILDPHCRLMGVPVSRVGKNNRDYLLDGLNIQGETTPEDVIGAVRNFLSGSLDDPDKPRMNLLLYGPSGTGKTEFVRHLGRTLSVPVVTKMGSDILSRWLGGTEQNIAAAFEEAEHARAILFFDEIDGLLQSRARAQRSWEVTQVNELLHRMEKFNGVMIGATNFRTCLDPATMRRFTFKLRFDWLNEAGKRLFFERQFNTTLTPGEAARLAAIQWLTPGDFRTVRQSLFYLGGKTDNARRLAALEQEAALKNGERERIGF